MKNLKSRIRPQSIVSICSSLLLLTFCFSLVFAQKSNEDQKITFVNNISDKLPIKVEVINAEKGFILDKLQIKVTNIGQNNIYQFRMSLKVIDIRSPLGETSIPLRYGRKELDSYINELANENDIPIKPDESVTLQVSRHYAKVYKTNFRSHGNSIPKSFRLDFGDLSFGDGTGIFFKGKYEKKNK